MACWGIGEQVLIQKIFVRIKGYVVVLFNSLVHGRRLKMNGFPSVRRGFSLIIESPGEVYIGKGCFFNNDCSIVCRDSVVIGDNCMFAEGVKIYDHDHRFRDPDTLIKDQGYKSQPVIIGSNCWLANNVIVLKGTSIGSNTVIGAGCVVHGDIPENSIVSLDGELVIRRRDN